MSDRERAEILRLSAEYPRDEWDAPPAAESELAAFEAEFGPIPVDHRWYLATCGSGGASGEHIFGLAALTDTHHTFLNDRQLGFWPLMDDVFVIGVDGCGNPYGIHTPTGRVVVEDHDFGGLHVMAVSYAELFLGRDK